MSAPSFKPLSGGDRVERGAALCNQLTGPKADTTIEPHPCAQRKRTLACPTVYVRALAKSVHAQFDQVSDSTTDQPEYEPNQSLWHVLVP